MVFFSVKHFLTFSLSTFLLERIIKVDAGNVLCIAPFPAISHFQMLEPLMLSLAQRGHNVTVMSHFPQKNKIANYTDISLRDTFPPFELDFERWSLWDDMVGLFTYGKEHCRTLAGSDLIQKFLSTTNKFDLIFIEAFDSDCLLGFVAKFKVPFILFSAMAIPVWESDWIYNPTEPGYLPDNLCRLAGKMNFYDRLQNIACHLFFRGLSWFENTKPSLEIIREHFHVDIDSLADLKRNVSFIFVNSFYGITGVRPYFPNVIEIGGIHLKPSKTLPQNFEKFLKESSEGVVVISMGSIVKSHTLDPSIKNGFLSVISKLKEKVLWKWEVEFSNKTGNLMTVPWLPQSDILGHPNVKLFISHGGIHGIYEAIYNGVPIIGVPLFGDQIGNLKALELQGVAVVIDFPHLNEKTLAAAINRVLGDESYKKNAEKLSRIFRDQPQSQLDKAIFWTEYVIRHKGAPHLRNGASELYWPQHVLTDIVMSNMRPTSMIKNRKSAVPAEIFISEMCQITNKGCEFCTTNLTTSTAYSANLLSLQQLPKDVVLQAAGGFGTKERNTSFSFLQQMCIDWYMSKVNKMNKVPGVILRRNYKVYSAL